MGKPASKKVKLLPYDIAEQLRTPEDMAAYLDAWLDEFPDDVEGITRALGDIARAIGMTQIARETGLSRESLYKALGADGNPSFATILKVAKSLGLRLHASTAPQRTVARKKSPARSSKLKTKRAKASRSAKIA